MYRYRGTKALCEVSVYLTFEQHTRLNQLSGEYDLSYSELFRQLCTRLQDAAFTAYVDSDESKLEHITYYSPITTYERLQQAALMHGCTISKILRCLLDTQEGVLHKVEREPRKMIGATVAVSLADKLKEEAYSRDLTVSGLLNQMLRERYGVSETPNET